MNRTVLVVVAVVVSLTACGVPEPPAEPANSSTELPTKESPPSPKKENEAPPSSSAPPAVTDELVRDTIREAWKAYRENAYNYSAAILAARAAYHADEELRRPALRVSNEAHKTEKAYYEAEDPYYDAKEQLERERKQGAPSSVTTLTETRMKAAKRVLDAAWDSRSAAYLAAAEAWTSLLPTATHEHAAAAAEQAAGMNPGAFGEIGAVHAYFIRCTNRINPLTGIGEQKRCYDYGVAMLTYFELNPISEVEDQYESMNRFVVDRMEAIGWKTGSSLSFEVVR